jgi:hypothetical protein
MPLLQKNISDSFLVFGVPIAVAQDINAPSPKHTPLITVESSINKLSDLLGEMEEDDPPGQSQQT